MSNEPINPAQALGQMQTAFWFTECFYAAAELGIADIVGSGECDVAEIARQAGAHEGATYRLMRALASFGIFRETSPRRFAQTLTSQVLCRDAPGSMRGAAIYIGRVMTSVWSNIVYSVRTGEPAFEYVHGMKPFDYFAKHPDIGAVFDQAMAGQTAIIAPAIAAAYDYSPFGTIIDIGGGRGVLLAAILKAAPNARAIDFDQPQVLAGVVLPDRCVGIAGDFFREVPAGGDLYLLKFILHDWDDERALTILRNVARAMTHESTLLIIESVIPPGNAPFPGKLMDIHMLVNTGGRERSEDEFRVLLADAGLQLARVIPAHSMASIVEAKLA